MVSCLAIRPLEQPSGICTLHGLYLQTNIALKNIQLIQHLTHNQSIAVGYFDDNDSVHVIGCGALIKARAHAFVQELAKLDDRLCDETGGIFDKASQLATENDVIACILKCFDKHADALLFF